MNLSDICMHPQPKHYETPIQVGDDKNNIFFGQDERNKSKTQRGDHEEPKKACCEIKDEEQKELESKLHQLLISQN